MKLIALFDEKNYKQRSGIIRETVRTIIIKNDKLALVKSLKENHYKFPGGGIEDGESHIDTLIREIKEETGLIIKSDSIKEWDLFMKYESLFLMMMLLNKNHIITLQK